MNTPQIVTPETLAINFLNQFLKFRDGHNVEAFFTNDEAQVMLNTVTLDPIAMIEFTMEAASFVKKHALQDSEAFASDALIQFSGAIAGMYIPALAVMINQMQGTDQRLMQQLEEFEQKKAVEYGYSNDPNVIAKNLDFNLPDWNETI